jgi:hypothetical protein
MPAPKKPVVIQPRTTPKKAVGRKVGARRVRDDGATDVKAPEGKPGNSPSDQAWIDKHLAELRPVDEDEDVPFGVRTKWSGKAEDAGSEFQIPPDDRRCVGEAFVRDVEGRRILDAEGKLITRHCSGWRMKGSTVCFKHGGGTEASLNAARRRLVAAVDPAIGHLVEILVSRNTETGDRLKAIAQILDRAGVRGGMDVHVANPEWQGLLKDLFTDGRPAPEPAPEPPPRVARVARRPRRVVEQ